MLRCRRWKILGHIFVDTGFIESRIFSACIREELAVNHLARTLALSLEDATVFPFSETRGSRELLLKLVRMAFVSYQNYLVPLDNTLCLTACLNLMLASIIALSDFSHWFLASCVRLDFNSALYVEFPFRGIIEQVINICMSM